MVIEIDFFLMEILYKKNHVCFSCSSVYRVVFTFIFVQIIFLRVRNFVQIICENNRSLMATWLQCLYSASGFVFLDIWRMFSFLICFYFVIAYAYMNYNLINLSGVRRKGTKTFLIFSFPFSHSFFTERPIYAYCLLTRKHGS